MEQKSRPQRVGFINDAVINTLNLTVQPNTPIYLSETNIEHMQSEHPEDYLKYGDKLMEILSCPDYLAEHPRNGSIQYIKVFYDETEEERVLVAVRTSRTGVFYARSLFVMSNSKIQNYERRGAFKKYQN